MGKLITRLLIISIILLLGLQFFWQTMRTDDPPPDSPPGTFPVDPLFREYYQDLGGENLLGPAISLLLQQGDSRCQYTLNVQLCNNPIASDAKRFFLFPLGRKIITREDVRYSASTPGDIIVDGFIIYPDFVKLFQELGENTVGKPLTQARYNYEQQRIEQYFENMGFYHRYDETAGSVHLLPYGAYVCNDGCRYNREITRTIIIWPMAQTSTPFASIIDRLGGLQMFGQPLTQAYEAPDGMVEQVFENVVVFAPKDDFTGMRLRPLPNQLGMYTEPPILQKYGTEQHVIFYPTEGELGHHVPIIFDQFLAQHGGVEISGNPIADVIRYPDENLPRQCFENYCLDFHENAPGPLKVQLAPLGIRYLKSRQLNSKTSLQTSSGKLVLQGSELQPEISANSSQSFLVLITREDDQQPVANVATTLVVNSPDGRQFTFQVPPTGTDGLATLTIPSIPDLGNGSLVIYQICITTPAGDSSPCVQDSYLIWNYQ